MKKIVYVLVFDEKTIYFEQALASIWSLKHYNDNQITIVTDEESYKLMQEGWRAQYLHFFNEIISKHFDVSVSNKERSRILKTSLREIISGDFIFIDTDTVITGSLAELDSIECEIAMVEDMNCAFIRNPHYKDILSRNGKIFGERERNLKSYYNSGVIVCKDSELTHRFWKKWNKNWEISKRNGLLVDQPALYETCLDYPNIIFSLSGIYNCQAVINVSYLASAKIMHFFNTKDKKNAISPFIDGSIYKEIKLQGGLSEEIQQRILHCKESFDSPIMLASGDDILAWHSKAFDLLKYISLHHRRTDVIINIVANKILNFICKEK